MDVSSALLSQLLREYLRLLFLHGGMVSHGFPHAPAPRVPPLWLQLGRQWRQDPSPTSCKVTALFIPHFFASPTPSSNMG